MLKFFFCLFAAKFLNVIFLMKCLTDLLRSIWFHQTNQYLDLVTLVLTNQLLLLITFLSYLMLVWNLIYHKLLIRHGINLWCQNAISGNLWKLLLNFLFCQWEQVVLNWHSCWDKVNSEVSQSSVLEPILLFIYINNGLSSNCKLFADDNFLFSMQLQLL